MLNFFSVIFNKNKKNMNDKVIYTLFYKEQFKYLKTTHSYHLVDPSPWRAAVRRTIPFSTQRTHLGRKMLLLRKLSTGIFYFYTYYCLGLACRNNFLSTAGQTGKRIKRLFKPSPSTNQSKYIAHRKFQKGTMLNAMICELSSLLGMGIRYSRRNFWGYVCTQTNYQYCSRKVIGEVRKNKFSSWSKMNNEPTDFIHNKEKRHHKFSNNNELFYKASGVEALIEAWVQLKSNLGTLTSGFETETLHRISKQWFEKISEKLRRGDMKYPSVRRIEILKLTGKSGTKPLTISNPRIKVIERAFLNALEPQFEGIFNWELVTKEEY